MHTSQNYPSELISSGLEEEEKPVQPVSNLKFVTSPWNTKCLVLKDYLYNAHAKHGNKQYFRCHNYSRYFEML